jgi:hypothetical protein
VTVNITLENIKKDCRYEFLQGKNGQDLPGVVSDYLFDNTPYTGLFMSHEDNLVPAANGYDPPDGFALSNKTCPNTHALLAVWNKFRYEDDGTGWLKKVGKPATNRNNYYGISTMPYNFSAMFCEPRYYSRDAQVVVDAATGNINSSMIRGGQISIDNQLTRTHFEYLMTIGKNTASTPAFNVSQDLGLSGFNHLACQIQLRNSGPDLLSKLC